MTGPTTFFIAETRSSLHELNKKLRVQASENEKSSGPDCFLPLGYGGFIYSMPPYHSLCFHTKETIPRPILKASIEPDARYAYLFSAKPPKGIQGCQLFRALLQDKAQLLVKSCADRDIVVLASGIDSFIPAILLGRNAKAFIHVVATKHLLGVFQAYLVVAFFRLTGYSDKLIVINPKWGVYPKEPSHAIRACEEYSLLGERAFLHKYFIDIVAREYISDSFHDPVVVTGDTIGIFSAFNGTLQRDRPFLLGRLRGSFRRLLKSRLSARAIAFLYSFRCGWQESCARSLATIMLSSHADGRFTSYKPSYSYLRNGFNSEAQHRYFLSVVKTFSDCSTIKTDFAGAIGFLHRALYLHPAIRRGAELNTLYGMGHSFVNTSLAFVPFMSPRDSISKLLFRPKWLQYLILGELISPLSWRNIFECAINDTPPKIIKSLDGTYYNLFARFRRGPLGY
ncbi:hypothetical protein KBY70_05925 [Cyanobium sp. ATX 6E8]|uniref:hypothetical protein n=1 Tax=Cyanobium sp. ATX 6E8 TaxID=2823701 RepID=UPI0020CE2FBE|nr:hypothetical protein [Cyanobium sp. ATX 6E8]MCP9941924.1 hypothetical protein [Cyanobium sp. ATX 6E8]